MLKWRPICLSRNLRKLSTLSLLPGGSTAVLYVGLDQSFLQHKKKLSGMLQLLTGNKKHVYITTVLKSLHWFPVCFCISFKFLLHTIKALRDLLFFHTPSKAVWLTSKLLLDVLRSKLKLRGTLAFAVAAKNCGLHLNVHTAQSRQTFKCHLKKVSVFFSLWITAWEDKSFSAFYTLCFITI